MNIRTLCLGILQFEDATGYEINKLVADGRFSHFIEASYGSIYPALTKMMQEELGHLPHRGAGGQTLAQDLFDHRTGAQ